ncbi:MAG: Uma2 family endonuclease [Cyanobacteria bacterium P01_D01_bin.73]
MTYTPTKSLTVEEFLQRYGDDPRYELIDGELRDLEPTGPHETVAGKLAGYWFSAFLGAGDHQNWIIPKNCLIQPSAAQATALRPDVVALDSADLAKEPLWEREPVITSGQAIRLVAEVVSTNWQDDYARKVDEYLLLGISEYWIVDFRGLGGLEFIGRPKQPTVTVCQLRGDRYEKRLFRLGDSIISESLPDLALTLQDLLP